MLFVSIGGSCQVAGQLRRAFNSKAAFFDNIVSPFEGTLLLLANGLDQQLRIDDLFVDEWEGTPSVKSRRSGIYFHHEFTAKSDNKCAVAVEEYNIYQNIDDVNSKFAHLANRFLSVARSDERVCYIRREYNGIRMPPDEMLELKDAIAAIGGRNFAVANAHEENEEDYFTERDIHYVRVERHKDPAHEGAWRGDDASWDRAFALLEQHVG